MTSRSRKPRRRRQAIVSALTILGISLVQVLDWARQRSSATATPVLAPHRPPVLVLAQPLVGESLPDDRPIILFRFAAGEPADPVDVSTFSVSVDGEDRSALFRVTNGEAWGPLSTSSPDGASRVASGEHHVGARVCSVRGSCTRVRAVVIVAPFSGEVEDDEGRPRAVSSGPLRRMAREIEAMTIALAPHEREGLEAVLREHHVTDKDRERAELRMRAVVALRRGAVASEKKGRCGYAHSQHAVITGSYESGSSRTKWKWADRTDQSE